MGDIEKEAEYTYHCKQCSYDLCKTCVLTKTGTIKKEDMSVVSHSCKVKSLEYRRANESWTCSMTKDEFGGSCLGHFPKEKNKFRYQHNWGCKDCAFNICVDCLIENKVQSA